MMFSMVCFTAVNQLGGWEQIYIKTPERMHLHLPSDHPTLPWTHLFGLFLLNINYWCANQTVMQRALAVKKQYYLMAIIIIIPGIAE